MAVRAAVMTLILITAPGIGLPATGATDCAAAAMAADPACAPAAAAQAAVEPAAATDDAPFPPADAAPGLPVERVPSAELLELAMWAAVKDSFKPADLQLYLDKFPQGSFIDDAQRRIAYLATPAAAIAAAAPGELIGIEHLPLLDTQRVHTFGSWRIYRRPSASRVRVQALEGGKAPLVQADPAGELYYFYYGPQPGIAAALRVQDGASSFTYQSRNAALRLRGCAARALTRRVPAENRLDFRAALAGAAPLEVDDDYAVHFAAADPAVAMPRLQRHGAQLLIALDGVDVALAADNGSVSLTEADGDRCLIP